MECESVHAAIEIAAKNLPVYSLEGCYTLVRMARKSMPYKVIELSHSDLLDFKTHGLKQNQRHRARNSLLAEN